MLLYNAILKGGRDYPERTALISITEKLSYRELAERVNRLGNSLRSRGVTKGDYVAVLLPNCPEFVISYYAISAIGAICVPANPLLKSAELSYLWNDAGVMMAITNPALLKGVTQTAPEVSALQAIICTGDDIHNEPNVLLFNELLAEASSEEIQTTGLLANDPAVCIYTSGTTGRPKGAQLSHKNLTTNCTQFSEPIEITPNDNFLCVLPLFHSFAATVCMNTPLHTGGTCTLVELFHPARVTESIEKNGVTVFAGVPAMYSALLNHRYEHTPDLSTVRVCISGGAPMPVSMMQEFENRFNVIMIEGDGPTECSPVTSVNPLRGTQKPGSIGLPLPGVQMKIMDSDDRELAVDEIGEIVVRGDNVMLGYLNQPEATAEAMKNGWYHTGDLGKKDEDGFFFIVDRKKDMLIVGGLNVYPKEVEEVLYAHPAVMQAAVIGAPDRLRGEMVVAVIVLKPDKLAADHEIIKFCRERLANYKAPRRVLFRESMPLGGTGKVLKRLLRKEMEMEMQEAI